MRPIAPLALTLALTACATPEAPPHPTQIRTNTWICHSPIFGGHPIIVIGERSVITPDETYPADTSTQGSNHRWDFEIRERDEMVPFAFLIKPNGEGELHDLALSPDLSAPPEETYRCQRRFANENTG